MVRNVMGVLTEQSEQFDVPADSTLRELVGRTTEENCVPPRHQRLNRITSLTQLL